MDRLRGPGLPIRIFHWSLAAGFLTAYFTGDGRDLHEIAGYAVLALIAFRVAWGFVGPKPARFASVMQRPGNALTHLAALIRLRPRPERGHGPVGGVLFLALLAGAAASGVTGYLMTTDAFWGSDFMERAHSLTSDATLALAGFHVAGILAASIVTGENLIRGMITGKAAAKLPPDGPSLT